MTFQYKIQYTLQPYPHRHGWKDLAEEVGSIFRDTENKLKTLLSEKKHPIFNKEVRAFRIVEISTKILLVKSYEENKP
jgi:hypothetical protein